MRIRGAIFGGGPGRGFRAPALGALAQASCQAARVLGQWKLMNLAAGSGRSVRQTLRLLQHFDCLFHREQDSSLG